MEISQPRRRGGQRPRTAKHVLPSCPHHQEGGTAGDTYPKRSLKPLKKRKAANTDAGGRAKKRSHRRNVEAVDRGKFDSTLAPYSVGVKSAGSTVFYPREGSEQDPQRNSHPYLKETSAVRRRRQSGTPRERSVRLGDTS